MPSIPCALCGSTGATVRAIDPDAPCCEDGALDAEQFTAAHVQQPEFTVGQRVAAVAFTDCFGVFHPEVPSLTVTDVRLIKGQSIPDYYRFTARGKALQMVEGAGRFFRAEVA